MNEKQVDSHAKTVINRRGRAVKGKTNAGAGTITGNEKLEQERRIDKASGQVESGHGTRHEQPQS